LVSFSFSLRFLFIPVGILVLDRSFFVFLDFFVSGFVFSIPAERLAGKKVFKMTKFVSSRMRNFNSINQLHVIHLLEYAQ